jgi:L-asparaginase/Glu-tRNA(Gln) amidotransferase subunit D
MGILVITTGGTIGAEAYPDPEHPPEFSTMPKEGRDIVRETLSKPEFGFAHVSSVSLEAKDSKNIDEIYLKSVLSLIAAAPETEILITFGTDRILHAAEALFRDWAAFGLDGKLLILTGSMTPLANGHTSDGHLNLTFALQQLERLDQITPSSERTNCNSVHIVLSDWEYPDTRSGAWLPRLYPFSPGKFEKRFANDGRRSRLVRI